MKAIVDCNNFYCSCERLFKPKLDNKPVIVLSNNDGCIISRSNEAKKLGVEMAGPYFMAKPLIEKYNVAVFSSNYNLYGDLSWRVMETLRMMLGKDKVEVYSVDEAFLDLDIFPENEVQFVAEKIKDTVEQWTGIKVSVGVAPTKVLAKVANRLSKKKTEKYKGVMVLHNEEEIISVEKKSFKLFDFFAVCEYFEEKYQFGKVHLGGVVGSRLLRELKGITSKDMEDELINKKMIATTRMFGSPVGDITSIKEAVATYTSRAAEKLRRQHSAAKIISVFVVTKEENHQVSFNRGVTHSNYITLPAATSLTNELIKPAVSLVDKLYDPKKLYKKAGVMLSGIVPDNSIQANLFFPETKNCERKLMEMIDNVNFSQRDDVLKFAASGTERNWKMQQNFISGRHTTRWDELFEVY